MDRVPPGERIFCFSSGLDANNLMVKYAHCSFCNTSKLILMTVGMDSKLRVFPSEFSTISSPGFDGSIGLMQSYPTTTCVDMAYVSDDSLLVDCFNITETNELGNQWQLADIKDYRFVAVVSSGPATNRQHQKFQSDEGYRYKRKLLYGRS